jgi:protein TonB
MKNLLIVFLILISSSLSAQQIDTTKKSDQIITDSIFSKVEVEAYFPGGEQQWNLYVQQQVEKNIDKIVKEKKSAGTCEVQFIVDKDGTVTNVEALTLKKSYLAKVLVNAIKDGPKWVPAFQFGKPVKAWRRQKVTFRMP